MSGGAWSLEAPAAKVVVNTAIAALNIPGVSKMSFPVNQVAAIKQYTNPELLFNAVDAPLMLGFKREGVDRPSLLPLQDGTVVSLDGTLASIKNGNAAGVPFLVGHCDDELKFFSEVFGSVVGYFADVIPQGPAGATRHLRGYFHRTPSQDKPEDTAAWIEAGRRFFDGMKGIMKGRTDADVSTAVGSFFRFVLPSFEVAAAAVAAGQPVYMYNFAYDTPHFGASHTCDLPFFFGRTKKDSVGSDYWKTQWLGVTEAEWPEGDAMSDAMMGTLGSFARSGAPEPFRGVHWDGFPSKMTLNAKPSPTTATSLETELFGTVKSYLLGNVAGLDATSQAAATSDFAYRHGRV